MNLIDFLSLYGHLFDSVKIITRLSQQHVLDKITQSKWSVYLTRLEALLLKFRPIAVAHITSLPPHRIDFMAVNLFLTSDELQICQNASRLLQELRAEQMLGDALQFAINMRCFLMDFICKENEFILKCGQLPIQEIKNFLEKLIGDKKQEIDPEEKSNYIQLLGFLNKYRMARSTYVTPFSQFYNFLTKPELAVKTCLDMLWLADKEENIFLEKEFYEARSKCQRTIKLLSSHFNERVEWFNEASIMETALPDALRLYYFFSQNNLSNLKKYYKIINWAPSSVDFSQAEEIVNKMEVRSQKIAEFLRKEVANNIRIDLELKRRDMNVYNDKIHRRVRAKSTQSSLNFFAQRENEPDKKLLIAAREGKIDDLNTAISQGASINARAMGPDCLQATPLIMASRFGNSKVVSRLIKAYHHNFIKYAVDFRAQDARGYTALHWAAQEGSLDIAVLLIGADPELLYIPEKEGGNTPWHLAIEYGHDDMVAYMGNVCMPRLFSIKNKKEQTPFMLAYDKGQDHIIQSVVHSMMTSLDKEAALNEAEKYALAKGNHSRQIFDILLGELSQIDQDLLHAARAGDWGGMMECLENGANIKVRDVGVRWGNYTVLMHAVEQGNADIVCNLIELDRIQYPIDFLAQSGVGARNTALHLAAMKGHEEITEMLSDACREALYISEDEFGFTPLHWAIKNGHVNIVKLIVTKEPGVLRIPTSDELSTPLRFAITLNQNLIASILWGKIIELKDDFPVLYQESLGYVAIHSFLKMHCATHPKLEPVLKNLILATHEEIMMTMDILTVFKNEKQDIFEYFYGGQIHINDEGHLYEKRWKTFKNKTCRDGVTSHESDDPQYSIQGMLLSEGLFGTRTHNNQKHTWVQTEKFSTSLLNFAPHSYTYLKYRFIYSRKWNYGPYGESRFVESNPYRSQQRYRIDDTFHDGLSDLVSDYFQNNQQLIQASADDLGTSSQSVPRDNPSVPI